MRMTEYPNWFAGAARVNFEKYLAELKGKPDLRFCQVGAFTGDASLWLMSNILTHPTSVLVDVDTWQGSPKEDIHMQMDWKDVESTYNNKVGHLNIVKRKMDSREFFFKIPSHNYDFVYIDGDHTEAAVWHDAINGFRALKIDGILAFDDYTWGAGLEDQSLTPAPAIDKFLEEYDGYYSLLEKGGQVWLRKIR